MEISVGSYQCHYPGKKDKYFFKMAWSGLRNDDYLFLLATHMALYIQEKKKGLFLYGDIGFNEKSELVSVKYKIKPNENSRDAVSKIIRKIKKKIKAQVCSGLLHESYEYYCE